MKRKVIFFILISINLCINYAFSAGIYENANQSAEFIRTLTRYASTDIDSAFYNPAGTAFMKNGLYAYLSDQMLFDYQTITDSSMALIPFNRTKYEGEAMTWAFPDIYAVYKQDNWSAFLHMGLIGRGADATYNNSLPMVNKLIIGSIGMPQTDGKLEAYSYFIGITAGGAYKVNDMFSLGGGVRYIHAEQNTTLKYSFAVPANNIDYSVDASGDSCGFIGSFNVKPLDDMNIGFRYEYYTTMKVKNDKPDKSQAPLTVAFNPYFDFLKEGYYQKQTLPMNAAMGISYMVTPLLKVEGGFIYYFNKLADWGNDPLTGQNLAKEYDNGYDISISLEYAFLPQLKCSAGYSYSVSGVNSKTRNNQMLGLDANSVGIGGTYTFASGIDLTVATMINIFKDTTEANSLPDTGSTKYEDRVYSIAVSVGYKFL